MAEDMQKNIGQGNRRGIDEPAAEFDIDELIAILQQQKRERELQQEADKERALEERQDESVDDQISEWSRGVGIRFHMENELAKSEADVLRMQRDDGEQYNDLDEGASSTVKSFRDGMDALQQQEADAIDRAIDEQIKALERQRAEKHAKSSADWERRREEGTDEIYNEYLKQRAQLERQTAQKMEEARMKQAELYADLYEQAAREDAGWEYY